ncbi:MAG: DedA family protein, partial [Methanobacteriota archaeon]
PSGPAGLGRGRFAGKQVKTCGSVITGYLKWTKRKYHELMLTGLLPDILNLNQFGGAGEADLVIYSLLFIIILLENGVPPMIWLPGDSLLFLSGMLASAGHLDMSTLLIVYMLAAFFGYQLSYTLGFHLGLPLINRHFSRIITEKNLKLSGEFYCKWGNAAITMGRFIPVIRTITPFLAGISKMNKNQFTAYNILGAMFWPSVVCGFGYLCGIIPWLETYREIIFGIISVLFGMSILCSLVLILISLLRTR